MFKINPSEVKVTPKQNLILIGVLALGIGLRLAVYICNRSIWLDEASLALNVIHKSFSELFFQPLDYNQAAPVGFLFATKLLVTAFGHSEYVLRVLPLLSGLAGLVLFYKFLIRYTSFGIALMALLLFSISTEVLRYSTEFKQYSSDILCLLILATWAIPLHSRPLTIRDGIKGGILGAVVVWFSYPSVFMLAGIGMLLLWRSLLNKGGREVRNLTLCFACWILSFTVLYFLSLKDVGSNVMLQKYWDRSFIPLRIDLLKNQLWAMILFLGMFHDPAGFPQVYLGCVVFFLGIYAIHKKESPWLPLLWLPLFMAIVASAFHKYPFRGRHLLFYLPCVYLFLSSGLAFLMEQRSVFIRGLGFVILAFILWVPGKDIVKGTISYTEDVRPILNYVGKNIQKGDTIYLYYGARRTFDYYARFYGLDKYPLIRGGVISSKDKPNCLREFSRMEGAQRVWVIFTHISVKEERSLVNYLQASGKRWDSFGSIYASTYLYQFAEH